MSDAILTLPVQDIIEPVDGHKNLEMEIVRTIPLPISIVEPSLPEWLGKMRQRQNFYNERHNRANEALFDAYQDFMSEIDAINTQFKTNFDLTDVVRDFENKEIVESKI